MSNILFYTKPEQLFSEDKIKEQYRELAKKWHPDFGGKAEVFAHITSLYERGLENKRNNAWGKLGCIDVSGKIFAYQSRNLFEGGEVFVSGVEIAYKVTEPGLFDLPTLPNANDEMKKEMSKFLFRLLRKDKDFFVFEKGTDGFLLADILKKGPIPEKHVAWVISRLYNIACYLQYAKLVHCDISKTSVLVYPGMHSAQLVGGWWYTHKDGSKLKVLPSATFKLFPSEREASSNLVLEQIRALGRELMGNREGIGFYKERDTSRKVLQEYFTSPAGEDAVKEYASWTDVVIKKAFGERKFVIWELNGVY